MISSGNFNVQNFQSLLEKYETALRDVTDELDSVQAEQVNIKRVLGEKNNLSLELQKILAEKTSHCEIDHQYTEKDLIENLKQQIHAIAEEKECAVKLWQNATDAIEHLENELRVYQNNTEGLIPKTKLIDLKNSYEEKLSELQKTVTETKNKLEETINLKSKELSLRDKKITGSLESQNNSFKIIKNLEDEVLNLQKRLDEANKKANRLENEIKHKNEEVESSKKTVEECKSKVKEAVQVVEAAFNEKDAALFRESEAKEEVSKLSLTLNNFIDETDEKIRTIKQDHETKLQQMKQALHTTQELVKLKEAEVDNQAKRCCLLEMELEKMRSNNVFGDDTTTSQLLTLEKNLEKTFQKLLLSEKNNIQLKAQIESLKNDFDQMAHHYERDINAREAEKTSLNSEIKKLKLELEDSYTKMSQKKETVNILNQKLSSMEITFKEQLEDTKASFQQTCQERKEIESVHKQIVEELQEQLLQQTEINKKWRSETKMITEQLEKVISELKIGNTKMKQENKSLNEKLKEANLKMLEYRKFLEMISQDVTKITTITLSEKCESER